MTDARNTLGRNTRPRGDLLAPSTRLSEQKRASVGARGFEPLAQEQAPEHERERESEAGPAPQESEPLALSLEDRLYVALAKRGHRRIGRLILDALPTALDAQETYDQLFDIRDERLVELLERRVWISDE